MPWLSAGDLVKEDDVLMQIETDKVTIDVRYTESEAGTLTEYLCKEDDTVAVGQEVVRVDKGQHTHSNALICTLFALWIPFLGSTPHRCTSALHGPLLADVASSSSTQDDAWCQCLNCHAAF